MQGTESSRKVRVLLYLPIAIMVRQIEWLIKKTIYTAGDVQNIIYDRYKLSEWFIRKTIYTVANVQNIVSHRSSDLSSLMLQCEYV